MLRFLNWPRRLIWKMKYGRLAMSDCPVMGEGLGHVWVSSGDDDKAMACSACKVSIPKAQPAPPRCSWLVSVKATIQWLFQRRPRL